MEGKDILELRRALNAMGDKITEEEKEILVKGALAGDALGEKGIDSEDAIGPVARLGLAMEALAMQDLESEREIFLAIIALSKKVTKAIKESEKFDELKANYFELGVDLEFYLNTQDRYGELAIAELEEMDS